MQDYRKSDRNNINKILFQIGFIIYNVVSEEQIVKKKKLGIEYLATTQEYEKSGAFKDHREGNCDL